MSSDVTEKGRPRWSGGQNSALTAKGLGSIPGWGARIPYAAQHSQKKKEMGENRNGEGIKTWTSLGKTSQE